MCIDKASGSLVFLSHQHASFSSYKRRKFSQTMTGNKHEIFTSQIIYTVKCRCAAFGDRRSVNSIFISGMLTPSHLLGQKVKSRWLPLEGNFVRQFQSLSRFCMSVTVLYTTLIFSFCLVRLREHSRPWKKCTDEILLDQFYIFECLKGFIIAVWPKNCLKLTKDGKLTVNKDVHLIVSSSNFLRPFYQVSRQLGNLFSSENITCNSLFQNIFEILKLISIF